MKQKNKRTVAVVDSLATNLARVIKRTRAKENGEMTPEELEQQEWTAVVYLGPNITT